MTCGEADADPKDVVIINVIDYDVIIAAGLLVSKLALRIHKLAQASSYVLIFDEALRKVPYTPSSSNINIVSCVQQSFSSLSLKLVCIDVTSGEDCKSRATKTHCEDMMMEQQCNRSSCVISLGGGTVSDVAGFVAATFMRGVRCVHVPTTFLGMVDASIGGKTAINVKGRKNSIGAFHQPLIVIVDLNLLATLSQRHIRNGMAEVIKAGAIRDASLFEYVEDHIQQIQHGDMCALRYVIVASIRVKVDVVRKDEKDSNIRAILNFGHSIGHAYETLQMPTLLHGEAVALGMIEEARLAHSIHALNTSNFYRLRECIKAYGLPHRVPNLSLDDVMKQMCNDKKNDNGIKKLVVLTAIGSVRCNPYTTSFSDNQIRISLDNRVCIKPSRVSGCINVPGSKSISNRVLLMCALGRGCSRIEGFLYSEDTNVMMKALIRLGVSIRRAQDDESILIVDGVQGKLGHSLDEHPTTLYFANAGTASRFMTTAVTLLPAGVSIIIDGNTRMQERPILDLVVALRRCGCRIDFVKPNTECLPIRVYGGGFPGGVINVDASMSSQFVSSLLLSAPYAHHPLILKLDTQHQVCSRSFITLTLKLMAQFGVIVDEIDPFTFQVPNSSYMNPSSFLVEGDASSATYALAMAAISSGEVTIHNVGSSSIQGDAKFCMILSDMGCTVTQTSHSTCVRITHTHLTPFDVDFSDMSDTFMTAAVVASVACGTSVIRNIGNQRVKECNRIDAIVQNLLTCGIKAKSYKDNLHIMGKLRLMDCEPPSVIIDCRDDHRIAMSFAVLACRIKGIIIGDKHCVGKTYEEFWLHSHHLGVQFNDVNTEMKLYHHTLTPSPRCRASIVVIGMRGVGKSRLSEICANHLGRQLFDIDEMIEKHLHMSIKEYVQENGWQTLRSVEYEILHTVFLRYSLDSVISCGGGVIESIQCRSLFTQYRSQLIVIEITRHIDDIIEILHNDDVKKDSRKRPSFCSNSISDVYQQRRPWFDQIRNFEFAIGKGDMQWDNINAEFIRFTTRLVSASDITTPLHRRVQQSFFLSLTNSQLQRDQFEALRQACSNVDAVELRVDLLDNWYSIEIVREWLCFLRRLVSINGAALIFTVRSKQQGGQADFSLHDSTLKQRLLSFARQFGVDYIDVESSFSSDERNAVFGNSEQHDSMSSVIGSIHQCNKNIQREENLFSLFDQASLNGLADVVKVVINANHISDAIRIHEAGREWSVSHNNTPVIALAMGNKGKLSRVLNQILNPVTHEHLTQSVTAPGQMTLSHIIHQRTILGMLSPSKFVLVGSPIDSSPSAAMHNAAFVHYSLPYEYLRNDTHSVNSIIELMQDNACAGMSITMPLKEKSLNCVQDVCVASRQICAINALQRRHDGTWCGFNTDYIGVVRLLTPLLARRNLNGDGTLVRSSSLALVIGAGGTARACVYALQKLGFKSANIFVFNRSVERAKQLCFDFSCRVLTSLNEVNELESHYTFLVIINAVPASASFTLPKHVLCNSSIVLDVNYLPHTTSLTQQAIKYNCIVARGIDMLLEQGIAQFESWTGRQAPRTVMRDALYQHQRSLTL